MAINLLFEVFDNVVQFVNWFSFKPIYSFIGFWSSGTGQSKKNFMFKEEKLYKINNRVNTNTFKLQNANFQKNQKEFRVFLKDILNLVHN